MPPKTAKKGERTAASVMQGAKVAKAAVDKAKRGEISMLDAKKAVDEAVFEAQTLLKELKAYSANLDEINGSLGFWRAMVASGLQDGQRGGELLREDLSTQQQQQQLRGDDDDDDVSSLNLSTASRHLIQQQQNRASLDDTPSFGVSPPRSVASKALDNSAATPSFGASPPRSIRKMEEGHSMDDSFNRVLDSSFQRSPMLATASKPKSDNNALLDTSDIGNEKKGFDLDLSANTGPSHTPSICDMTPSFGVSPPVTKFTPTDLLRKRMATDGGDDSLNQSNDNKQPRKAKSMAELDLSLFPAVFQNGDGAQQLKKVFAQLKTAKKDGLSIASLRKTLVSFETERITLLVDLLHSRGFVQAVHDPTETRWRCTE